MSELNITRKIFLEREELLRLQEFLRDDVAFNAIVENTTQYGIIQTEFVGFDTNFQVGNGTNPGTISINKDRSQAIDIDGNLIRLLARDNIAVTDDSSWYWVRISYTARRHEVGTVDIASNGQITGTGTTFTEVLRGQATDVPVKVKFINADGTPANNNSTYEVVEVVDDTNAEIIGSVTISTETGVQMVVIGTTPIGEIVSTVQLEGIYMYDSCLIELIAETATDTPPALPVNGANRYFYVARVMRTGSTVAIQDKRNIETTYWKFNVPGVVGAIISRATPAPANVGDYMLLGSVSKTGDQFAFLNYTGNGGVAGFRANLRLSKFAVSTVLGVNVDVIRDAVNVNFNPRFFSRDNTTDNVFELWVQTASQVSIPTVSMMPGNVAIIGESLTSGATSFQYASSFSWTSTVPDNLTAATVNYAVYSASGVKTNYDSSVSAMTTNLSTLQSNVAQLQTDTAGLRTDLDNIGLRVRLRAQVNADATGTKLGGDLTFSVVGAGRGLYAITHNLNSTDYLVLGIGLANSTSGSTITVASVFREANGCTITTNDNDSAEDGPFEFILLTF